jgi:hypothetical protein
VKLQYLGDSKDSFTWDYHDYLAQELCYPLLNIALMMTPDDASNDGKSHPSLFRARHEIVEFCEQLRAERSLDALRRLPETTGSRYTVKLHNESVFITNQNRSQYFLGLSTETRQLLFLDPDNGFEPEKSYSKKHVLYSDIASLLEHISDDSVISVFQHFRRKSFVKDFAIIKQRLYSGYATAIYWHSLMFVAIGKSQKVIAQVSEANKKYSRTYPVKVMDGELVAHAECQEKPLK